MTKQALVEVWASVFGKDVKVTEVKGDRRTITDMVVAMVPAHAKDACACAQALDEAVWSSQVQWFGNHAAGLRVISVECQ